MAGTHRAPAIEGVPNKDIAAPPVKVHVARAGAALR